MTEVTTVYDKDKFQDNYPKGIENGFWWLTRYRIIERTLQRATKAGLRAPSGRILEVGCGPGIVVAALRASGYDAWGVELGSPTVRPAAAPYVLVRQEAQNLSEDFRNSVETLLFLDVIEHIHDDVDFLRSVIRAFRNCRCVIVTVPARQEAWSNFDDYYGHIRRYSRETLDESLRKSGLDVVQTRYFFRSLYVAARLINAIGKKRRVSLNSPRVPVFQRLLYTIFLIEDLLIGAKNIIGLSLISMTRV